MNQRDLELLSAYLDGELKSSELTKLETRLNTDQELAPVLNDLRAARTLLRKLPQRRAPRNFTLTRKMVGQNPPLPRTYPLFRIATSFAAMLLFVSFAANAISYQTHQSMGFGFGGGGGSEMDLFSAAPAMEEAAAPAAEEPAMAAEPADPAAAAPTAQTTEDTSRILETPSEKNQETQNGAAENEPLAPPESPAYQPVVSSKWQIGLAAAMLAGLLLMWLSRQFSARRWK